MECCGNKENNSIICGELYLLEVVICNYVLVVIFTSKIVVNRMHLKLLHKIVVKMNVVTLTTKSWLKLL